MRHTTHLFTRACWQIPDPLPLTRLLGIKLSSTYMCLSVPLGFAAMAEWVPYELRWLAVFALVDPVRKLFKLNVECIFLLLKEMDFGINLITFIFSMFLCAWSLR